MARLRARVPRVVARSEADGGWVALWLLGLAVCVLFLGGLSIDLWGVFNERRLLTGLADAAAIAGASGLDEDAFRADGSVRLDPARASALAETHLRAGLPDGARAAVEATAEQVRVELHATARLALLRILLADGDVAVRAVAVARPLRSR